jgi:hypothetical protein
MTSIITIDEDGVEVKSSAITSDGPYAISRNKPDIVAEILAHNAIELMRMEKEDLYKILVEKYK